MKRSLSVVLAAALAAGALPVALARAQTSVLTPPDRSVEPVVITGDRLPQWSRLAAQGLANPYPSGALDDVRDAHNGTTVVPPDARDGVPVEQIAAYSFSEDGGWHEIPVQVDQRFPYFLANAPSDFAMYSGTDEELGYQFDVENWKKTAGECSAEYPEGEGATPDPVSTLDDDDEIVFMADDAGDRAPASGPPGVEGDRQEIRLVDPFDPGADRYVYLVLTEEGSAFTAENGYVSYERDADADGWIDRFSFDPSDPEKLGTSNRGYGPNLHGTVCDPDGTVRDSDDRFPRDGLTVTTDKYRFYASGRWMIREMRVAKTGSPGEYGPDLIDRWKGRAFQQSPDSSISLVGFEDEQVNWEGNSALLGERVGPVRAIRETWGADSGTNVTKTEYFYRDSIAYRYRVRVHPIPPDGLYTSWDYNHDQVGTYYNEALEEGVPIDGHDDEIVGNIDDVFGEPAFFDFPDPTFSRPLAFFNWEQISGNDDNGSLVYMFEFKNAQALENPLVVPYYRDDACFDDGTGDDPSPRPDPGRRTDSLTEEERNRPCYTEAPEGYEGPYRQGAFGSHGVHYFAVNDTDNLFLPKPVTEIDGQQWQWAVPTEAPERLGDRYANSVKAPLQAFATQQTIAAEPEPSPSPSEDPSPTASPTGAPSPGDTAPPSPTESPGSPESPSPIESSPGSDDPSLGPELPVATTTLTTNKNLVEFNHYFRLSGAVQRNETCTGHQRIEISRRVHGTDEFSLAGRADVDPDGTWVAHINAPRSASYIAEVDPQGGCDSTSSDPVDVLVRAGVEVKAPKKCGKPIRGRVRPNHSGTRVVLQRRTKDGWRFARRTKLNSSSRFRFTLRVCKGRFRVRWPSQSPHNLAGKAGGKLPR